jgi:hypothetical protein
MKIPESHLGLLSDFQGWNEGKAVHDRITLLDYVSFNATAELLLGFGELYFCELILVDDNYFIESRFDFSIYAKWKASLPDMRAIQRVINHVHIRTLLQSNPVSDELAVACAETIAKAWNEIHRAKSLCAEVHGSVFDDISVTLVASLNPAAPAPGR